MEEVAQNHLKAEIETIVLLFSMESIQVFLSFEAILWTKEFTLKMRKEY